MSRGVNPTNIRFLRSSVIFKVPKNLGTHDEGPQAPDPWLALANRAKLAGPAPQPDAETAARGRLPLHSSGLRLGLAKGDMRSASTATFSPSHAASPPTADPTDLQPTQDAEATTFQKPCGSGSSV